MKLKLFISGLLLLISTTYLKAQMNESLIYSNKKIFFINNSQLMPNVFLPSKKIVFSGNFFDGNQFMNVEENRVLFDKTYMLFIVDKSRVLIISRMEYCFFEIVIGNKNVYTISEVKPYTGKTNNHEYNFYFYILKLGKEISQEEFRHTEIWGYFFLDVADCIYSISKFNFNSELTKLSSFKYRNYFVNQFNLFFINNTVEIVNIKPCDFFSSKKKLKKMLMESVIINNSCKYEVKS
jgi:hypothetical protein